MQSRSSETHPLGWAFLGGGAFLWLTPFVDRYGTGMLAEVQAQPTLSALGVVFLATLIGLVWEFPMNHVEKILLRLTRLEEKNPEPGNWGAAWRTRWRFGQADAEFRRYEALASFSRAYAVHSILAGFAWFWWFGLNLMGWGALAVGVIAALVFAAMWAGQTRKIFVAVNSAAAWEARMFNNEELVAARSSRADAS